MNHKGNGTSQEEANALIQKLSIVPSTLNSHTVATNQSNMEFEINVIGNMTDCNFFIPDETGDNTGMAFRAAYHATATYCRNSEKELCAYVGSMLCSVVPGFRIYVEESLSGIGVKPRFISLPSQAQAHNIVESELPSLDWPSILVIFGYCFIILFKLIKFDEDANSFRNKMTKWISELRVKVGCAPSNTLNIPFGATREKVIRTMLGSHSFRKTAVTFLMKNFDLRVWDLKMNDLCNYMSINILSWSGDMSVIILMKEMLVRTNSPVLSDSRVLTEVDYFEKACLAVTSHTYPQFFNHVCSVSELLYFDLSRFPTLIAVAVELEKGGDGSYVNESAAISRANRRKVKDLVKLHWTAMAEKRCSIDRSLSRRFLIRGL